jgi:hypothetical protein
VTVLCRKRICLARLVFEGLPIVQLEFQTRVPWVLAEAEQDAKPVATADRPRD